MLIAMADSKRLAETGRMRNMWATRGNCAALCV